MISRRVFLKNGGFALVSLGFAPSFLARTAFAQGHPPRKQLIAIFQRGAVDGLSVVVPFGESEYYRARPSIAIAQPGGGDRAAIDLDGFFGFNPRLRAAQAAVGRAAAGHRARVRLSRQHALALRRAGLHGNGDARREEHVRRLAEPLSAGAACGHDHAVPRRLAHPAAPADARGHGIGARREPDRSVRHSRGRAGRAHRSNPSTPPLPTRSSTGPARRPSTR